MLAVTDPLLVGVITVFIGVIFTAVPATITAVSSRKLHKTLGNTNGSGTVTEMMHSILQWQSEHAALDTVEFREIRDKTKELEDYTHRRWHDFDNMMTTQGLKSELLIEIMAQLTEIRAKQLEIDETIKKASSPLSGDEAEDKVT